MIRARKARKSRLMTALIPISKGDMALLLYTGSRQQELLLTAYQAEGHSTSLEQGVRITYLWQADQEGLDVHLPRIREGTFMDDMRCVFAPKGSKTMRSTYVC
jgi:hypothetical protein